MYLFTHYVFMYIFCGTGQYQDFVQATDFMFTSKLCASWVRILLVVLQVKLVSP